MGRSKLVLALSLIASLTHAQVQVWNQDLNGSTNANKIVSGIQNHAIAAPTSAGGLYWSGTTWLYTSGVPAVCGGDLTTSGGVCGAVQSLTPTGGTGTIIPFNASGFKATVSPWNIQDNGGVTRFSLETTHGRGTFGGGGTDALSIIGPLVGSETTRPALYLLQNGVAGTGSNFTLTTDDVNFLTINGPASSTLQFYTGNSVNLVNMSASAMTLVTPPLIQFGSTLATGTLGTNKAGAGLLFQTDAGANILQLYGGTQGGTALSANLASIGHFRYPAAFRAYTRNSANSGDKLMLLDDGSDNLWFGADTYASLNLGAGSAATINILSIGNIAIESSIGSSYVDGVTVNVRDGSHNPIAVFTGTGTVGQGNTSITGSMQVTTRTITGNLTVDTTTTDYEIAVDTTGGAITVTLPAATAGRVIVIYDKGGKFGTNACTVARHSTETIDGVAASKVLTANGAWVEFTSPDGTNWNTN